MPNIFFSTIALCLSIHTEGSKIKQYTLLYESTENHVHTAKANVWTELGDTMMEIDKLYYLTGTAVIRAGKELEVCIDSQSTNIANNAFRLTAKSHPDV